MIAAAIALAVVATVVVAVAVLRRRFVVVRVDGDSMEPVSGGDLGVAAASAGRPTALGRAGLSSAGRLDVTV